MNRLTLPPVKRTLAMLLALVLIHTATAATVKVGGLYFNINISAATAELTYENLSSSNYASLPDSLTIPSSILYGGKQYFVTSITDRAFRYCTSMKFLSIPSSIKTIGTVHDDYETNKGDYSPFYGCASLKYLRFEDGAETVYFGAYITPTNNIKYASWEYYYGNGLFYTCPIKELYIGRPIDYLDYDTSSISNETFKVNYKFHANPPLYGTSAFAFKRSLNKIELGRYVTSLPVYTFYGCTNVSQIISRAAQVDVSDVSKLSSWFNYTERGYSLFSTSLSKNTIAYVPSSSLSSYMRSNYWNYLTVHWWSEDTNFRYYYKGDDEVAIGQSPATFIENITVPCEYIPSEYKRYSVSYIFDNGFENNVNLTSLTLPSSIKEIGSRAFYGNTKLSNISFNEGLQTIGNEAFYNCTSLVDISLPDSLKTIGDQAFYNNTSITNVSFNEGLISIGGSSFRNNTSLTAIRLPNSLSSLGNSSFQNCAKLTYVSLSDSLQTIGASAFQSCTVLTEINIPGTVKSIGNAAFKDCSTLTLATLNPGTLTMGTNVFANCKELLSITIPGTVTSIGYGSFDGCSSLSSVTFSNGQSTLSIPKFTDSPLKTLRIGRNLEYAYSNTSSPFYQRTTLKRVQFTGDYVTNIYNYLLDGCNGITFISLPENLQSINGYAFRNCAGLPEITLPASLTTIGGHAFDGCVNLSRLTVNDSQETLNISANNAMFHDCPLTSIYMGRNIEYATSNLKYAPFYDQSHLNSIVLAENFVTKLNDGYLQGASKLGTISLPESIESIGSYAFANCSSLTAITMPNAVRTVGAYGFSNCESLSSIKLSENLISLENGLFSRCSNLQSMIIPASVSTVGNAVFNDCFALNSVMFIDGTEDLTVGYNSTNQGLFNDSPLQSAYIGRNLTYTADSANGFSPFYKKSTLTELSFSNDGTITTLHDYLFAGCSAVKNFRLPESLNSIGNYTFSDMNILELCVIPNAVTTIGVGAFKNDVNLAEVTLSNQLKVLSQEVFFGCSLLDNLTIPSSVTIIDNDAFNCCNNLTNLNIVDGTDIMTVGINTIDGNRSMFADSPIANLYFGRWLSYDISDEKFAPFYGKGTLTHLTLGKTVGTIGKYLFEKCTAVESVNIPGVESIGEKAFYDCSTLSNVSFNEGTRSIGEQTFASCTSLKNIKLPSTVVSLSDGCFMNDINLSTLDLGNSLEIIGPSAFSGCSALQELVLPKTLYGLGVESFKGCTSLPYLTVPDGCKLSSIGARSFQGCTGLEWLSLSDRITSMGANSFDGCTSIRYIKSFNPIPPVGLPNFTQNVLDNATVFVPVEVVDDYKDADAWWDFFNIRGLGDGVFVSYLNIDKEEATLKAAETVQIVAEIGPTEATNREVGYLSDNMDVATVDNGGVVTAVAVGEANIKAYAKDGSGYYKTCKITVVPTLMESLMINETEISIKVNRTAQLTADVLPATTTNKAVVWRSSNSSIVSVNKNGEIVSKNKGTATIAVSAADGSGKVASCVVTVLPPTRGDSNDNDEVTVTDAVNTANYAVGNPVDNFCFEAADVNGDNRITLSDASGTITEVLNQPLQSVAMKAAKIMDASRENEYDRLIVDDYSCADGNQAEIEIKLDNTIDYVALQADVTMPEGMSVVGMALGARAEANHSLMYRNVEGNSWRVAVFSLDNMNFADNGEAILNITVRTDGNVSGDIELSSILASDSDATEYALVSAGGSNKDISGIGTLYGDGSVTIVSNETGVVVYNAQGKNIRIFSVDGALIAAFKAESNCMTRDLSKGVYVVSAGNTSEKVIVK